MCFKNLKLCGKTNWQRAKPLNHQRGHKRLSWTQEWLQPGCQTQQERTPAQPQEASWGNNPRWQRQAEYLRLLAATPNNLSSPIRIGLSRCKSPFRHNRVTRPHNLELWLFKFRHMLCSSKGLPANYFSKFWPKLSRQRSICPRMRPSGTYRARSTTPLPIDESYAKKKTLVTRKSVKKNASDDHTILIRSEALKHKNQHWSISIISFRKKH